MHASIRLLDAYKRRQSLQTDSAAGDALGLSRSAVSLWRKGTSHPDADSIEKMANAIGEPVGPWLAQIEAERARSPANRQVWLRLAATLGTTLALAVTALPSHANRRPDVQTPHARSLPIVSNLRRWIRDRLPSGFAFAPA